MTRQRDDGYYSVQEVIVILKGLSKEQLLKLEMLSQLWTGMLRGCEPKDLFYMIIEALLEGDRQWPRGLPAEVFFKQAMRSIASQYNPKSPRARLEVRALVSETEISPDDKSETPLDKAKSNDSPHEWMLECSHRLAQIQRHFWKDKIASRITIGVVKGDSRAEILADIEEILAADGVLPMKMEEKILLIQNQYNAALTRIRRYIRSRDEQE
jgi:hypothetical protein